MKRAAIYARFSTDLQNDRSNEDQIAVVRKYCARNSFAVVGVFTDAAISGASTANRPGFQNLMRAVEAGGVDCIVVEDIDRLSRDQADYHAIRKRIDFLGVEVHALTGRIGRLDGSIHALKNELFLENLVAHTRRGLEAVINSGRAAGGRCYGYALVPGKPGERTIVEAEAEVIRRIFAAYLAGKSPRQIAHDLNREGIAPPRGRSWRASTINGNGKRGNGMLRNPVYAGRLVWNRVRMVKHPVTAKRVSQPNAEGEWVTVAAPALAIVTPAQYDAVQARKAALSHNCPGRQKRPRHLLSGLLRCGCCGGGMSAGGSDKSGRTRIRCSAAREGGTCPAPRTFYLDTVERVVVDSLRAELAHPEAISAFVKGHHDEHRRLAAAAGSRRAKIDRRLAEVAREIDRLVDAIAKGHGDPAVLGPRSTALAAERRQLEAEIATLGAEPKVIALHPAALRRYERTMERLQAALGRADRAGGEAAVALRDLVDSVTVARTDAGAVEVTIAGRLNSLLGMPEIPGSAVCGKVVAGRRYSLSPQLKPLPFLLRKVA